MAQYLLPGIPWKPNKPDKVATKERTKKGKLRTLLGYEKEVQRYKSWTSEEKEAQEYYEETGIDNTDGTVYWSFMRR